MDSVPTSNETIGTRSDHYPPGTTDHPGDLGPPPGRGRRWARRLIASAVVVALAFAGYGPAAGIVLLFVLLAPVERIFRRHPYPRFRPGLGTDVLWGLTEAGTTVVVTAVAIGAGLLSLSWLPGVMIRPMVAAQPGWLRAIEAVLILDVILYWAHRLQHEIPLLWRFHAIHHSSERMDWVAGLRNHPLDFLAAIGPIIFMLAAGWDAETVGGVYVVLQTVVGLWAHLNVRWRLRPLHKIILTPEFHHWHHANEPDAINTNYSVFLPVWDLIWGTYYMPPDRRPQVYGTDDPVPTRGVWGQFIYPFRSHQTDPTAGTDPDPPSAPAPTPTPVGV